MEEEIRYAYQIPNDDYLIIDDKKYQKRNNDGQAVNLKPLFPTMNVYGQMVYVLEKFKKINKNVWELTK